MTDAADIPLSGVTVCLYEADSDQQIVGKTNGAGRAYLNVPSLDGMAPDAEIMLTAYAPNAVPKQTALPSSAGREKT